MLLDEAKNLLFANHIEFQEQAFENETAFLRSLGELCPGGRPCAVAALTIPCKNGRKDISLHFIEESGRFLFEDLWFGDFSFELFDLDEESLPGELLQTITDILEGKSAVITAKNLKNRRLVWDGYFDKDDPGYKKRLQRIQAPKHFWKRLLHSQTRYEIFDYYDYRCMIK